MKSDYTISDIYQGGYSSLSPSYGDVFTGYRISASELGAPTKIDTANQIQQVNQLLNQGIVPIEVGAIQPEVFDQIPKQHFKEINRMAKLTGAKISVHAPLIEPSGIDPEQRRPWDESYRELAEQQLNDVVEKSIEMDDKGGMPITIHSAGIPGTEYKMTDDGKKVERLIVINKETGKMAPLEEERKFYPGGEIREETYNPEKQLQNLNHTEWDNSLSQVEFNRESAERIIKDTHPIFRGVYLKLMAGESNPKDLSAKEYEEIKKIYSANEYIKQAEMNVNSLFSKAYKYGSEQDKEKLKNISKQYGKELGITSDGKRDIKSLDPKTQSAALFHLIQGLHQIQPNMYVPIEDFAVEHSAKTFANVAFNAYDKFKDKAPKISIENVWPGAAFAYGEGMDKLIIESKKKFVEKAVEEGYSKSVAETQADKMIGMTLDVGHLNIAKKKGFEDKDLIEEVKQIAKHVKHVHLTDNFGYGDSHLPPGMGNVPFKEILEELEKKGNMKDVRKIVEAGGFVQHFGTSPYPISLEAMGSPIYAMAMAPYWNQAAGLQQGYSSGYGQMLPPVNYETFGAGFSQLPSELGGQRAGAGGERMSGRGME